MPEEPDFLIHYCSSHHNKGREDRSMGIENRLFGGLKAGKASVGPPTGTGDWGAMAAGARAFRAACERA